MSKAHVCQFVFEKNVTHVHVSGTPVDPTGAVAANIAGKYTCICGAFELGAAQRPPTVEHLPADDSEGGEL